MRSQHRSLALALLAALLPLACGDDDGQPAPDAGSTDARVCTSSCDVEGQSTCDVSGGGRFDCVRGENGCLQKQFVLCDPGQRCYSGTCRPCSGEPGTFPNQAFADQGETRRYLLHVPDRYTCETAWPVLVDLHGTAGPPRPEEAYGLEAATDTAEASGFLLLRPRSRSGDEGGSEVYRWDQNPGDPEQNRVFLEALVSDLASRYFVDPARVHVMGFSSGTNQTAVALASGTSPFSGYGFVGGGSWTPGSVPATAARLYLTTGWRDYMWIYQDALLGLLDAAGVPSAQVLVREADAGHELYGWMVPELWAFLDQGVRPAAGSLAAGWTAEDPGTGASLLALASAGGGDLLAAGSDGTLVRRSSAGAWSGASPSGTPAFPGRAFTSACVGPDGTGLAVGAGLVARSDDGGATWTHAPAIPDLGDPLFGYSHLNAVACGAGRAVAIGYWSGASTHDGGDTFADVAFLADYDARAQGAAIRVAPWGTWIAAGYWAYVGRSGDGTDFAPSTLDPLPEWVNDVAPVAADVWVAVGEGGRIWRSVDDGATFEGVHEAPAADLYAVSFRDATTGLAVGRGGAAFLTTDGGQTWTDVRAGVDRFLGDVAWLDGGEALVVGEAGTALVRAP
jgi:photosystem II stability/assembly factor-like uncharacterized protein/predicted esterase